MSAPPVIDLPWPEHAAPGDIAFLSISHDARSTVTAPAGWTLQRVLKPSWWVRLKARIARRPITFVTVWWMRRPPGDE